MSQIEGKTMRCPFDANHVMPYDRFLNHLDKCKFPDKKSYVKCRFNPYHVIHKSDITRHEDKCQDRKKYQQEDEDDDWGIEEEVLEPVYEKKEKSTVSSAVTAASNVRYKKEESNGSNWPRSSHNDSKMEIDDFDNHNFSSSRY